MEVDTRQARLGCDPDQLEPMIPTSQRVALLMAAAIQVHQERRAQRAARQDDPIHHMLGTCEPSCPVCRAPVPSPTSPFSLAPLGIFWDSKTGKSKAHLIFARGRRRPPLQNIPR